MTKISDALDKAIDAFQDEVYEAQKTYSATEVTPAEYESFCSECRVMLGSGHHNCDIGEVESELLRIRSLHN